MTLKLTNYEIQRRLDLVKADLDTGPAKLHLFQNNVTPTEDTVLTDLTEANFSGYAAANLDYSAASGIAAHVATATPTAVVFTRAAGATSNSIYGYYVTNQAGTQLLWAERDPAAPIDMSPVGATYTVTAKITGTDA